MAIKINYDEAIKRGWSRERLDELTKMDYLTVQPYHNIYDWLDDLSLTLIKKEQLPIREINLCGGRKARKTYQIVKWVATIMAISIKYDLKIAVYGFRWLGADINEFKQEFETAVDELGLRQSTKKITFGDDHYLFKNASNKPIWKFINGSFISLRGIHNSKSSKISLKGLSQAKNYDLGVSICEEANEFDNSEFQAIDFAVRGIDQYLKIKMSNPDNEYQDFIKYCMERYPFNEQELRDKGYQLKIVNDKGIMKLFEYANYQINPYLKPDEVKDFKELERLDPLKYRVWGLGMPGALEGAVFSHYVNDLEKGENFKPTKMMAGLDLGQADGINGHPTVLEMVGMDAKERFKPLFEYFHSNATMEHKDPDEIAHDVCETLIKPFIEYKRLIRANQYKTGKELDEANKQLDYLESIVNYIKKYGMELRYDYGGGGLYEGDRITKMMRSQYPEYAPYYSIKPVDKSVWFIKDRVDITIGMMVSGSMLLDQELTPHLLEQMNIMEWKIPTNKNSSHELKLVDLNDDCWDAFMYAIMPYAKTTLDNMKRQNEMFGSKTLR